MGPITKNPDWQMGQGHAMTEGVQGLLAFVTTKWKLAAGATIGLLAILAGIAGYFAWSSRQETQAWALLFQAVSRLEASPQAGGDGIKQQQEEGVRLLREVMARHPKTAAAAEATLRLGALYYAVGDYSQAREVYAAYLARNPSGRIALSAGIGVADTYVAQKDYDKAVETYSRLTRDFPDEPLLGLAQLHLARTYLQMNRANDAIALYEKVASSYPNSGWAQIAQAELHRLTSR